MNSARRKSICGYKTLFIIWILKSPHSPPASPTNWHHQIWRHSSQFRDSKSSWSRVNKIQMILRRSILAANASLIFRLSQFITPQRVERVSSYVASLIPLTDRWRTYSPLDKSSICGNGKRLATDGTSWRCWRDFCPKWTLIELDSWWWDFRLLKLINVLSNFIWYWRQNDLLLFTIQTH